MTDASLDGRSFRDPSSDAVLRCREQAGIVWGTVARHGGGIALALGTRHGDVIDLRCCHVDDQGATSQSAIRAEVSRLPDGRLRLSGSPAFDEIGDQ
ncbi:MAG TPA: hypothetical protein VGQ20_18200 [Acidimicrobiales bacterium]|jgi:hypothetical protein|nr:hypothetical protein [Acidimicrobiales bacterium]